MKNTQDRRQECTGRGKEGVEAGGVGRGGLCGEVPRQSQCTETGPQGKASSSEAYLLGWENPAVVNSTVVRRQL